jgi:hypothetical protein
MSTDHTSFPETPQASLGEFNSCDCYPAQILYTGSCLSVHRQKPVQSLGIEFHLEVGCIFMGVLRSH